MTDLASREHELPILVPLTDTPDPLLGMTPTFDEVYQREYQALLGLGFVLTGSRPIAEDLVQDSFAEAHKRWAKVAHYDNIGAWLRRVLVNKATSRGRRLVSEAKMLTSVRARRVPDVTIPEDSSEVWAAVRALPKRQAQSIALFYWEDRTIAQIAEILECGEETVKTHLKRGRAALATSLPNDAALSNDTALPNDSGPTS